MSEGHFVTITVEWLPFFHAAKSHVAHIANVEEKARKIGRIVRDLVVAHWLEIGAGDFGVRDMDFQYGDETYGRLTIRFNDRDTALLFKLTHGGTA